MSTAHDWKRIDIDWYKCAACGSQISALADYAATKFGCAGAAPKAEYTAVDMANAAADGFRDGAASKEKIIDALLNHCEDGECHVCSQIICPYGDGMHFHHDGCPSCAQEPT